MSSSSSSPSSSSPVQNGSHRASVPSSSLQQINNAVARAMEEIRLRTEANKAAPPAASPSSLPSSTPSSSSSSKVKSERPPSSSSSSSSSSRHDSRKSHTSSKLQAERAHKKALYLDYVQATRAELEAAKEQAKMTKLSAQHTSPRHSPASALSTSPPSSSSPSSYPMVLSLPPLDVFGRFVEDHWLDEDYDGMEDAERKDVLRKRWEMIPPTTKQKMEDKYEKERQQQIADEQQAEQQASPPSSSQPLPPSSPAQPPPSAHSNASSSHSSSSRSRAQALVRSPGGIVPPSSSSHHPPSSSSSPSASSSSHPVVQFVNPSVKYSHRFLKLAYPSARVALVVAELPSPSYFSGEALSTLTKASELFLQFLTFLTTAVCGETQARVLKPEDFIAVLSRRPELQWLRWAFEGDALMGKKYRASYFDTINKLKRRREAMEDPTVDMDDMDEEEDEAHWRHLDDMDDEDDGEEDEAGDTYDEPEEEGTVMPRLERERDEALSRWTAGEVEYRKGLAEGRSVMEEEGDVSDGEDVSYMTMPKHTSYLQQQRLSNGTFAPRASYAHAEGEALRG